MHLVILIQSKLTVDFKRQHLKAQSKFKITKGECINVNSAHDQAV